MSQTKRAAATAAAYIGAITVTGLEFVIVAAAACTGGWVGATAPGVPTAWAGALAGCLGLGLAVAGMQMIDSFRASVRAFARASSSAPMHVPDAPKDAEGSLPSTPEGIIERLNQAARADAAKQAAQNSYGLDHARDLLHNADQWIGFEDNTAWFPLADGAYVQYSNKDDAGFTVHTYTFVVPEADAEPVTLTSMAQLRDLVKQHVNREPQEASAFA
ncbi:hypothetical protein [Streptomyces sp. NPDC006335]|uniref:hypothetical protein n=1 Tax=Streptomyces sp. NPDC006335 TaxID=3156895 RepID=UPI0033B78CFB